MVTGTPRGLRRATGAADHPFTAEGAGAASMSRKAKKVRAMPPPRKPKKETQSQIGICPLCNHPSTAHLPAKFKYGPGLLCSHLGCGCTHEILVAHAGHEAVVATSTALMDSKPEED